MPIDLKCDPFLDFMETIGYSFVQPRDTNMLLQAFQSCGLGNNGLPNSGLLELVGSEAHTNIRANPFQRILPFPLHFDSNRQVVVLNSVYVSPNPYVVLCPSEPPPFSVEWILKSIPEFMEDIRSIENDRKIPFRPLEVFQGFALKFFKTKPR